MISENTTLHSVSAKVVDKRKTKLQVRIFFFFLTNCSGVLADLELPGSGPNPLAGVHILGFHMTSSKF